MGFGGERDWTCFVPIGARMVTDLGPINARFGPPRYINSLLLALSSVNFQHWPILLSANIYPSLIFTFQLILNILKITLILSLSFKQLLFFFKKKEEVKCNRTQNFTCKFPQSNTQQIAPLMIIISKLFESYQHTKIQTTIT